MSRNLTAAVCVLLLTGCAQFPISPTPPPVPLPGPTVPATASVTLAVKPDREDIVRDYPRVDGSTSAQPLQVFAACAVFDVPCSWQTMPLTTERGVYPDEEFGTSAAVDTIYNITHNGTHGSYMNLIHRTADIILVARAPSDDELAAAKESGVVLEVTPVALDAFVFLVHASNPVESLTLDEIRGMYTGEITTWGEVDVTIGQGGEEGDVIHTYQRNPNSGSQELMDDLVMQGTPMIESPDMILESMMGPIHAIGGSPLMEGVESGDPLGIGYSVYYYVSFIFPHENVRMPGIEGVLPTSENIASRAYPLTTEVYVVIREHTPPGSTAILLRDWLLSAAGQSVVEESGYVPIR